MGRHVFLKQCPTSTGPPRDTSRQTPSCELAGCCMGVDIKICGLQNRERILDMAVGTLLGTANLINTKGRKSPGVPVTSELDFSETWT